MSEKPGYHESLTITKNMLFDDNGSEAAILNLGRYAEAKRAKKLIAFLVCSDSRTEPATLFDFLNAWTVSLRAIAAETSIGKFDYALRHNGVERIVTAQHFDGTNVVPGQILEGCGGLGAKAKLMKGHSLGEGQDVLDHINHIKSPDVFEQAHRSAEKIATLTGKEVLAVGIDHRTGLIYPFSMITDHGRHAVSSVPFSSIGNPEVEYEHGVPQLRRDQLTEGFLNLINDNQSQVAKRRKNPHLLEGLDINNPHAVIITTSMISAALRYPHIFGVPNTGFTLNLPFIKKGSSFEGVEGEEVKNVFNQVHYPISHAVDAKPGDSFYRTNTIIVETPDLHLSAEIAKYLVRRKWMKSWLSQRDEGRYKNILIAQINSGRTKVVEEFRITT